MTTSTTTTDPLGPGVSLLLDTYSLINFVKLMNLLEKHQEGFASVNRQFDSPTSIYPTHVADRCRRGEERPMADMEKFMTTPAYGS